MPDSFSWAAIKPGPTPKRVLLTTLFFIGPLALGSYLFAFFTIKPWEHSFTFIFFVIVIILTTMLAAVFIYFGVTIRLKMGDHASLYSLSPTHLVTPKAKIPLTDLDLSALPALLKSYALPENQWTDATLKDGPIASLSLPSVRGTVTLTFTRELDRQKFLHALSLKTPTP